MTCQKCGFKYDHEDAFCRKCGLTLAHEAHFNQFEAADDAPGEVLNGEVTSMEVVSSSPIVLEKEKSGPLSRLAGVLRSEQGKKLARGAALVAVGVGVELAVQALNKLSQNQTAPGTNLARLRENSPYPATWNSARPVIVESVTVQRIQTRTVYRTYRPPTPPDNK